MKTGDKITVKTVTEWDQREKTEQTGTIVKINDSVTENGKDIKVRFENGTEQWFWPSEYEANK